MAEQKRVKKRKGNKLLTGMLVAMFIISVALLAYTGMSLGSPGTQFYISAGITIACLIFIAWITRKWIKKFFDPAGNIIAELIAFEDLIKEAENDYGTAISFLRRKQNSCFSDEYLKVCLKEYLDEIERLGVESSENFRCDISDYINYDSICVHVKRAYAENVAASMTGIGILGTFVGLAAGLQSFDASSMTSMESSISPLIDGIKTAFYTSVYGVVISLIMNYYLKNRLHELDKALDCFYDAFYENVLTYPEYSIQKQSLQIQIEQRDILSNFAETMAISMSREMKELMVPLFDKMTDTLNAFSVNVANSQTEGMQKVVDEFIDGMNNSLGNQFDELGKVIQDTCEWQKLSTASMENVINGTKEEALNIADINDKLQVTVTSFDGYMDKLASHEERLTEQIKATNESLDVTMKALEAAKDNIESLTEEHKNLAEAGNETNELIKDSVNSLSGIRDVILEGTAEISDTAKAYIEEIIRISNSKAQAMEEELATAGNRINSR